MMKVTIGLFVLFMVTKQISCDNAGNSTASNETISSATAKPFLKKMIDFFKGSGSKEKDNSSLAKAESNSTLISSTQGSSTYNITTEQSARSTRTTAKTTRTTKPTTTITTKENASIAKEKEDALKKTTPKSEEGSTTEDSSADNATHGYDAGESAISERAVLTTIASGEQDLFTTEADDSNPTSQNEEPLKDEVQSSVRDDDLTLPEEVESVAPDHLVNNDTSADLDTQPDPLQHKEYCTNYIQKLVTSTLTKHADQLDPLPLRDRKLEFEAPFLLSSVKGLVGFHDGKVTGISQGRPIDECNIEARGDRIRLVSGIYIDEALINYKGSVTLLQFGPKITVNGKLSGILAGLRIVVPQEGGIGKIEEFRVTRVEGIEIDIKGLGVIDWSVEFISERVAKLFLSAFRRSIERNLRKALEDEIKEISYP